MSVLKAGSGGPSSFLHFLLAPAADLDPLAELAPADEAAFHSPVPTQIVSNGEFTPLPQTAEQRKVEARIKELADSNGRKLGMDRRQFLRSSSGLAVAFVAERIASPS